LLEDDPAEQEERDRDESLGVKRTATQQPTENAHTMMAAITTNLDNLMDWD
jgi:hypothetical protein